MQRAELGDLDQLVRLAIASHTDAAWAEIVRILRANPWSAVHVVAAAPWNDLHTDVQAAILSATRRSSICAAIAFARGVRDRPPSITQETAGAFFAAATPAVWEALTEKEKRMWLSRLDQADAHLAVRSLGIAPAFLTHAILNDTLIGAVSHHVRDDAAVVQTLLPIAVRGLPLDAVPDVIAALPLPPDPIAFVQIVGRTLKMPPALRDWIASHSTPQAHVAAMILLRAAAPLPTESVASRCVALAQALAGWRWEKTNTLLAALPNAASAALRPDRHVLAQRLTSPDRRSAFRRALDMIAALPPSVAVPARHTLVTLGKGGVASDQQHAGECLATVLQAHGDCFLAILDALAVTHQTSMLPVPDDEMRDGMRPLASADPLVAHRLAHALWDGDVTAALDALAAASLETALRRWRLLPDTIRSAVISLGNTLIRNVAAPEYANALAQTLREWTSDDVLRALLALRMLIDADPDRQAWGAALLAQHPDLAGALLPLLREDLRTTLASDPTIAFAGADLLPLRGLISARRRR